MAKRVTIVLDDVLLMKLRRKQAQLIKESTKSVSFSRVLNETLRKCIKSFKIISGSNPYRLITIFDSNF